MNEASGTKICPYCAESIKSAAVKCRYCLSDLTTKTTSQTGPTPSSNLTTKKATTKKTAPKKVKTSSGANLPTILRLSSFGNEFAYFWRRKPKKVHARGALVNRSDFVRDYTIEISYRFGSVLAHTATVELRVGPWTRKEWSFEEITEEDWGSATGCSVTAAIRDQEVSAVAERCRGTYLASFRPIDQWRGIGAMTKNKSVLAMCKRCEGEWELDSTIANAIAGELGVAGKMRRAGTAMEQVGGSMSLGGSGRRIAAGNEPSRMHSEMTDLFRLAACPHCRTTSILLSAV